MTGLVIVLLICMVEDLYRGSIWNMYQRYKTGRDTYPTAIPLTFQQFRSYYDLCPQEYNDIKSADPKETLGVVGYQRDYRYSSYGVSNYKHVIVFSSFEEYMAYVRFLKEQQRDAAIRQNEEEHMKTVENMTIYYQEVIKDIECLKARAEKEKQEAKEIILSNKTNLL